MTFSDIKEQIKEHKTLSFYVFSGDEIEVQRIYINKIAESKDQVVRRVDTVAEVVKARSGGLFGKSICFVCRDDMDFQKNEALWDKLESMLNDNTLIYLATKLDKRSKFYNAIDGVFNNRLIVFDHMTEPVLIKHIKEHVNLSTDSCKELIRVCEGDYGRILNEIDKINMFLEAKYNKPFVPSTDILSMLTTNQAFEKLLADGTIYQPPTDAIFHWVDAVLSGKPILSFKLWQECVDLGEPTLRLLLVLYQGVKRLLQVQTCQARNVSENTGLTQWEINLVKDYVGVYSATELVSALRQIKQLETDIKTGGVEEEYAVPYAMVSLIGEWV